MKYIDELKKCIGREDFPFLRPVLSMDTHYNFDENTVYLALDQILVLSLEQKRKDVPFDHLLLFAILHEVAHWYHIVVRKKMTPEMGQDFIRSYKDVNMMSGEVAVKIANQWRLVDNDRIYAQSRPERVADWLALKWMNRFLGTSYRNRFDLIREKKVEDGQIIVVE